MVHALAAASGLNVASYELDVGIDYVISTPSCSPKCSNIASLVTTRFRGLRHQISYRASLRSLIFFKRLVHHDLQIEQMLLLVTKLYRLTAERDGENRRLSSALTLRRPTLNLAD